MFRALLCLVGNEKASWFLGEVFVYTSGQGNACNRPDPGNQVSPGELKIGNSNRLSAIYIRRDTRVAYCSVRSTKIIQLRIHLVKQIHGCTSGGSVLEIFIFRLHQSTYPFQVIDFYFILFFCELHNSNYTSL